MRTFVFDKLLLGIALSLCLETAVAAESTTKHFVIDAKAMKASRFDHMTAHAVRADGGLRNVAAAYACFNAAVHLPHEATILRVTVAYSSGPSSSNPVAAITQRPVAGVDENTPAVAISALPSNSGTRELVDVPLTGPRFIDNRNNSYGFAICLDGAEKDAFFTARITYTTRRTTG